MGSGSDLTLRKSTSFEKKMSKQKHDWEEEGNTNSGSEKSSSEVVQKKSDVARPISPPKIKKKMSKDDEKAMKYPARVSCDNFKPSGSDLTLVKSTSFEEKMSKQKHHWEEESNIDSGSERSSEV